MFQSLLAILILFIPVAIEIVMIRLFSPRHPAGVAVEFNYLLLELIALGIWAAVVSNKRFCQKLSKTLPNNTHKKICLLFLSVFFIIATSKYTRLTQNTLAQSNQWVCTKQTVAKELNRAEEFFNSNIATPNNTLDLGVCHGFNEIIYKTKLTPRSIQFDFTLSPESYLYLIINKTPSGSSAIRLSNNDLFPSAIMTVDPEGKFLSKQPLHIPPITTNQWHSFQLKAHEANSVLILDKTKEIPLPLPIIAKQFIGFRGCAKSTRLDNISITTKEHKLPLTETFDSTKKTALFFIGTLALFILSAIIVSMIIRPNRFSSQLRTVTLITLSSTIIANSIYIYSLLTPPPPDYIKTDQSPFSYKISRKTESQTEKISFKEMLYLSFPILTPLWSPKKSTPFAKSPNTTNIMVLGTSQTWGTGASTQKNTWIALTEALHNSHAKPRFKYHNYGIPGTSLRVLFQLYQSKWIYTNPEVLILDISNNDESNDTSQKSFTSYLQNLIDLNKKHHIKTIFILEPNSIETTPKHTKHHNYMKAIAKKNSIPVLDMHQYFLRVYDNGFIWWDSVHLTDYGHRLFATQLSNFLKRNLQ